MNKVISISDIGSIYILDICLCSFIEGAKSKLSNYELEEHPGCLQASNVLLSENLPRLDIVVYKDSENLVNKIRIQSFKLNRKECDLTYKHFKKKFVQLNVVSRKKTEDTTTLELSNLLHNVRLFKQYGLGEDHKEICPFIMELSGKLISKKHALDNTEDNKQVKNAIKDLYFSCQNRIAFNNRKTGMLSFVKFPILIILLLLAYLFALNGRYSHAEQDLYLDKWTKQALIFNPDTGSFEEMK